MRRATSSASRTPDSRAEGSANGGVRAIGGGARRAQRTRTTTLPTFWPACSSRNAARSSPSQKEKVACGSGRTAPASTCCANRPSCACIHNGSLLTPGQLRQPSSISTATKSAVAVLALARATLQTPSLPISRKAPASLSSPNEAGVKSFESAESTAVTRPPRSCAPAPLAKAAASRELASAVTPSRRSVACLAAWPAVASTRAPQRRSCSSATSPMPPVAECSSTRWPARTCASRTEYATVTHNIGSVTASSKLSFRGIRPRQRMSVCSTERSEPGAIPKTRSPSVVCATSAPTASSRPDISRPSGRTVPVGSRPSTLSTSRKLRPAAATATTPLLRACVKVEQAARPLEVSLELGGRLGRRAPSEGAPTEAKRRTAAHGHHRTARRALQHRVRDRAAVPERRHTAYPLAARKRRQARRQRTRHAAQRCAHARVEPPQLRIGRRRALGQPAHQHQQARQARSRLGVPTVGLDAARRQPSRRSQRPRPRTYLDRVAQRGARPMSLEPCQPSRVDAALGQRRAQQRLLRLAVGCGEAGTPAVAHHPAAKHAGRGALVVLRYHKHGRAAAFAPRKAIGAA
eukprot:scaffold18119_cov76-Phaeocystis_antarctica.AAC.7